MSREAPLSDARAKLSPTGDLGWPKPEPVPVPAEVHSDDQERDARFDARLWLEQASDEEVVALAREEWQNSYEADAVARFFEEGEADVGAVFHYVEDSRRTLAGEQLGFECSLDSEAAERWLEQERPHLRAWLDDQCCFATPHFKVVATEFVSDGQGQGLEWEIRAAGSDERVRVFYESDGDDEERAIAYARELERERVA